MFMKRRVTIRIALATIAALMGFPFMFCLEWPHYRTREVTPGVFAEHWMPAGDFWLTLGFGIAFYTTSVYLFWSAYRAFKYDRAA